MITNDIYDNGPTWPEALGYNVYHDRLVTFDKFKFS